MSPQEADELMRRRGFTLGARTGSGIRMYSYTRIERTPALLVQIIPERDEFKVTYGNTHSINKIESPWCSPITDREHFKNTLNGVKKWARKIEELYEEE